MLFIKYRRFEFNFLISLNRCSIFFDHVNHQHH